MGCFAPDAPAPVNYGAQTRDTLQAQVDLAPKLYASEANPNYGQPAYLNLTLANLNRLLNGAPAGTEDTTTSTRAGQTGWYDASGKFVSPGQLFQPPGREGGRMGNRLLATAPGSGTGQPYYIPGNTPAPGAVWRTAGSSFDVPGSRTTPAQPGLLDMLREQNTRQRAADIGDVGTLGPEATGAILRSDPYNAALLAKLNAMANTELDAGSSLTPDEQRAMQQESRAAFAARGVGGGNAAIADELLRQFNLGQQLLRSRQAFATGVLGSNQAVIGDPFMQILGRPSTATNTAAGLLPARQFNPESPLSAAITSGNQGYAAMFADPSTISKVGAVSGLVGNFIGSVGGAMI